MLRAGWTILSLLLLQHQGTALENGLARTPPMGWLSWQRFRCNTDCTNDPANCISERLFMETADRMVEDGYLDLGYEYIMIDDCWLTEERDENGRLQADPDRFPNGISGVADYVHSRGLKLGIYEDYGNYTCAGYPGVLGHLQEDAETLASWNVDYIKLDGCYSDPDTMDEGYPEFGQHLLNTNQSVLYLCQWPMYQSLNSIEPNYTAVAEHCNVWRIWYDIEDSWSSVSSILDFCGDNEEVLAAHAGPGHWNDPDMLVLGNFGLSHEQEKIQMAMWSIMSSPLIMSTDLRDLRPDSRDILQNYEVIQVNQDSLGVQGRRVLKDNDLEIWTKPINPVVDGAHSWAVAVLRRRVGGNYVPTTVDLPSIGLNNTNTFIFTELFGEILPFKINSNESFTVPVPPTGVLLFKAQVHEDQD